MEENILSFFFIAKKLDVVHNQHIYQLIEMDKVIY